MSLKDVDFLSPPITLFHFKRRTHTSKIGGVLVISMFLFYMIYILDILNNLFTHSDLISMYYKKFEEEAGYFSFNTTSIFHFLLFYNKENGGYFDEYDNKNVRIFSSAIDKESELKKMIIGYMISAK